MRFVIETLAPFGITNFFTNFFTNLSEGWDHLHFVLLEYCLKLLQLLYFLPCFDYLRQKKNYLLIFDCCLFDHLRQLLGFDRHLLDFRWNFRLKSREIC